MKRFFDDVATFRKDLRSTPDTGPGCWSCEGEEGPFVSFNVRKDLECLGLSSHRCEPRITLCPQCAVAYMNAFNVRHSTHNGRKEKPLVWTVADYLAMYRGS